jgi:dimethylamine monooxygenase subunit A
MTARSDTTIRYRPYAFDPPANPMGNKLDADFGNGAFDQRIFQIDAVYPRFIENYDALRQAELLDRYVGENGLSNEVRTAVCRFVAKTLTHEYPTAFELHNRGDTNELHNHLLDETVTFDAAFGYKTGGRWPYRDGMDALAAQIAEDLAVVQVDLANKTDRLAAVHVTAPSGWDPIEKLGGPFVAVHAPVTHHAEWLDKVQTGFRNLAKSDKPVQRFGWGIANDDRLDHHPASGRYAGAGRIDGSRPLYVRVERQTLCGFPDVSAVLFTIRVHTEAVAELPDAERRALHKAVTNMSPAERGYKGLTGDFEQILEQL